MARSRGASASTSDQLVPSGQFIALAYPRFSPDGQSIAFAAISTLASQPDGMAMAAAHGIPWVAWLPD